MTERTHPRIWSRIQKDFLNGDKGGLPGKWNARKAQLAVKEYKRYVLEKYGDSGYKEPKKKNHKETNSLAKWTEEDWGYVCGPDSRYLPKKVRDQLTPAEKREETRRKKGNLGKNIPWSKSVAKKMFTLE